MGEIVEITTATKQQHIFYKVTSGALRFQVRGPSDAGISLASRPKAECDFWIVIGHEQNTVVLKGGDQVHSVPSPNIITSHEFREFWIQWYGNAIALGRAQSNVPFLVYKEDTFDFNYITFAVISENMYSLQWRFEMPPLLEKVGLKPISSGVPEWKTADDQLPDRALIGGYENEMLYIIRAKHHGSLTPGKFVPSEGVGYIPWGGRMHEKNDFEVLCGYDCVWIPCSNGRVPAGAVVAGYSEVERECLFVGRALYNNCRIPGKVQPSHNVCYIPYDGREISMQHYEILVVPDKNIHCANPFFMHDIKLYETYTERHNVVEEEEESDIDDPFDI